MILALIKMLLLFLILMSLNILKPRAMNYSIANLQYLFLSSHVPYRYSCAFPQDIVASQYALIFQLLAKML